MLVNNGYKNREIDDEIKINMNRIYKNQSDNVIKRNESNDVNLYYKNFMSDAYKVDERIIRNIIYNNVTSKNGENVKLIIYYKSKKIRDWIIKNNVSVKSTKLKLSNVVYKFVCKSGDCETCNPEVSYVGQTQTQLTRRITMHLGSMSSAIVQHFINVHDRKPKRSEVVENTEIIKRYTDSLRLIIGEALIIRKEKPLLNRQETGGNLVLKLY